MNFLAHLYLSYGSDQIAIGNFIGDFVKGKQLDDYNPEIKKGVLIHREIDRFTDSHEVVKKSKTRLWTEYRHYASVIVDVYFDHFLAISWSNYSEQPLKDYTTSQYEMLSKNAHTFPDGAQRTLKYMKMTDWLYNYQFLEGIDMALKGLSRRTVHDSKMETAAKELEKNYAAYNGEFDEFFPLLENHIKDYSEKI